MRHLTKQQFAYLLTVIFLLFTTGCLKDEFDNKEQPKKPAVDIPEDLKDFGFATQKDFTLKVDYNAPGFKTLFQIYAENPLDESGKKKEGLQSIFAAYTDNNSKYEGQIHIATAIKEVYLYTNRWGLPLCVKMESSATGFTYDATQPRTKATTKASMNIFKGSVPYNFGYTEKTGGTWLQSLCKWDVNGSVGKAETGEDYLSITTNIASESLGSISARSQNFISQTAVKSQFLSDASVTNITTTANNTELDLVFLSELAEYQNTIGYYYYKEGNAPSSRQDMHTMKKYLIFPNLTNQNGYVVLPTGATARLQFFGENYDQPATSKFPAGYVIGWFFISDGFNYDSNGTIKRINNLSSAYDINPIYFSDDKGNFKHFISLNDSKSGLVVLGFEDQQKPGPNDDYCDVLFYVKSSQKITNEERPSIPDDNNKDDVIVGEEPTFYACGTLGFEDIWPSGGDYDLNDVAVEYSREFTFNGSNNISSVTEKFKFVHDINSANFNNYFAYQAEDLGSATSSEDIIIENDTKSIILNGIAKESIGKEYTITRTLSGTKSQTDVVKDFNPYIIVNTSDPAAGNRKEVHLPNQKVTYKIDQSLTLTGKDAYFMNIDGIYPFAINIPILGFKLSPERTPIGESYPKYKDWANSYGKQNEDWYLQ